MERGFIVIPAKEQLDMPVPRRVAAYCRVSTLFEEQATSLAAQMQYWQTQIDQNPMWENTGIYADTASELQSGTRPEFCKLMRKCRQGKVDMILTKSISRFGRNAMESIKTMRKLQALKVNVYFELEGIYSLDPHARMLMEFYCAFAQVESENKSANIRWGVTQDFKAGTSGYAHFSCYGYRYDKILGQLTIEPEEAKVVREIFAMRAQGNSLGVISQALFEKSIPSPTGKYQWSRETINKILHNEKYFGSVLLQKSFVEDIFDGKQYRNSGQRNRYLLKNHHEAIVQLDDRQSAMNRVNRQIL
ncbi:MAG: recombinase family protein [Sporolactobacillus sp.]